MSAWPNLSDLLVASDEGASVALIGAPLSAGSITKGDCDRAPAVLRQTLRRIGRYDMETRREISTTIGDQGDLDLAGMSIEEATRPIRKAIWRSASLHALTLLIGGNNAVTRPCVLGLECPLEKVGLITLDAHLDMRDTDEGLTNGNPVRALMEDGLPGTNIAQVGLASFANTRKMHDDAISAGNLLVTVAEIRRLGISRAVDAALSHVAHCEALVVDCDIDVIDRSQLPAAPGARPGGMAAHDFFGAVRQLAADQRVRIIDLTEWDPPLDPTDLSALTAARWVAECLSGFEMRAR